MTEKELCEAFAAGRIEKRLFWQLMREKNLPLVELRELLALLPEGTRVEVDAEEVVLTFEGIRFAFDFLVLAIATAPAIPHIATPAIIDAVTVVLFFIFCPTLSFEFIF